MTFKSRFIICMSWTIRPTIIFFFRLLYVLSTLVDYHFFRPWYLLYAVARTSLAWHYSLEYFAICVNIRLYTVYNYSTVWSVTLKILPMCYMWVRVPDVFLSFEFQKEWLKNVGAVGVEISPLLLKRHIAYTTTCCYSTSRDTRIYYLCDCTM